VSEGQEQDVADLTGKLVRRLSEYAAANRPVTLFVGSGLSAPVVPTVAGMLSLADDYADHQPETAGLRAALARVRAHYAGQELEIYRRYRREFAKWVAGNEFDLIAQAAVLRAYQPVRGRSGPRRWQRVGAAQGERLEQQVRDWQLPDGVAALGSILARSDLFQARVFTTCFDPLLEIAVSRADGDPIRFAFGPRPDDPYLGPGDGGAVEIHHLYGFWRPDLDTGRHQLLHNPEDLLENREHMARRLAESIDADTICVLGHSGWDGILAAAVRHLAAQGRRVTVLWGAESINIPELTDALRAATGPQPVVHYFPGVNCEVLVPRLAAEIRVTVAPPGPVIRGTRHPNWERELVSEREAGPAARPLDLLRQLDNRFQWECSWPREQPVSPGLVFWPVRLRPAASVINMVQAIAAAALSAREVEIFICLDDFNVEDGKRSSERFARDIRRWFALVPNSRPPTIASLQTFIESTEQPPDDHRPRHLMRPIRPWDVAREALGDRDPTVLDVLMAAKIIPDLSDDQLMLQADQIVTALAARGGRHLMTPFTLWAQLNDLLIDTPTLTVLTLGGKEERRLWEMWRFAFDHGVSQLYNPTIRSLTNQSLMVRWADAATLENYLRDAMNEPDWMEPGHYVRWLVQNAYLLPSHLTERGSPVFRDQSLDSWVAVRDVLLGDHRDEMIKELAAEVSRTYLDSSGG
jgi:hypothetical protein